MTEQQQFEVGDEVIVTSKADPQTVIHGEVTRAYGSHVEITPKGHRQGHSAFVLVRELGPVAAERRMPEDVRDLLGELAKYSDEFNYGDYSQDLVKRTRAALDAAYGTGDEWEYGYTPGNAPTSPSTDTDRSTE